MYSSPITGLERPWGFQEFKGPRLQDNRHMKVVRCQPYAPAAFTPRKYSWYSFLLEAKSTLGPRCSRKNFVNEKVQWHHRESNPRPSGLWCSASTNGTQVVYDIYNMTLVISTVWGASLFKYLTKYSKGKQISEYGDVCDAHGVASLTRNLVGESIHRVSCPRIHV